MEEKWAQVEKLARELVDAVREIGNPVFRRGAKQIARELELALVSLDAVRERLGREKGAA